jgi:hypothetical protein
LVFRHTCKLGLEGIVSKRLGSRYRSGRSPDWLKFKNPEAPAVKREAEEEWRWMATKKDFTFQVNLVAVVRVRATDEDVARAVVPTLLGGPGSVEIGLVNENNAALGRDAVVTGVDLSMIEPIESSKRWSARPRKIGARSSEMRKLLLRHFNGYFLVTGPDTEPAKFKTRQQALTSSGLRWRQVRNCRPHQASVSAAWSAGDCAAVHAPVRPIIQQGEEPFAMFVDLQNKYDWVLQPVVGYSSVKRLIEVLEDEIVRPAEAKFDELLLRRTEKLRVKNVWAARDRSCRQTSSCSMRPRPTLRGFWSPWCKRVTQSKPEEWWATCANSTIGRKMW